MTAPVSNAEIADALDRHSRLLQVAGESSFRSRAFSRAAETLRVHPEALAVVATEGRLRAIPGIGEGIATAIAQILKTGDFDAHVELTRQFPESLIQVMTIPGVGPKTAQRLYSALQIADIPSLETALVSGQIRQTKGLGPRVDTTIRAGLESLQRRTGRTPLGEALPIAFALIAAYERVRPEDTISLAGSARRWDVTVGDLDFVIATSDIDRSVAAMQTLPMVTSVARSSETSMQLEVGGVLAADIFFTEPSAWGSTLVRATGSAAHLARLGEIPEVAPTEQAVYAAHNLPWIPPELRSGAEEFERWQDIDSLVTIDDVNGEIHAHTTWSDGKASITDMAAAAAGRGYTFLGITDHSHGLGIAGGLDVERLAAQRLELDDVDGTDGVKLLAGAEVEVHRDGSLDFDSETLAHLDVVVASLHTGLRQPGDEVTERLIRVLENPNVDIIAHPCGRLIERREGGAFDWDRVFATAARTGTALEINADPARLDLDPDLARRASAAGCLISINCDAHSPAGFSNMAYGVAMARKAWLTPLQILNCWPREQVLTWLRSRGSTS